MTNAEAICLAGGIISVSLLVLFLWVFFRVTRSTGKTVCPRCGRATLSMAHFCPSCGTMLVSHVRAREWMREQASMLATASLLKQSSQER